MSKLIRDIVCLILEELQDDEKTLCSCLSVNKTFSEITISILWKNPWKFLKEGNEKEKSLLNIIISHLSDESKNNLNQKCSLKISYQRPLFNYVNFCKHLNLNVIQSIINNVFDKSEVMIVRDEILNLFINGNTRFTHLYIPYKFDYPLHLISGANHSLSDIEYLSCNTKMYDDILSGLTGICKSIKELELIIKAKYSNHGIVKLIDNQKKLLKFRLLDNYRQYRDESFREALENSLIKHADTIQYFKITKQPTTKILSSFINLRILELYNNNHGACNCLEDISLPSLQILRVKHVPIKFLISLIENTSGHLVEISIFSYIDNNEINNKRIIQVIYQNSPKLKYLRLMLRSSNILELENLLVSCQNLNGLFIMSITADMFDWNKLFEILTSSSPISLSKFKFYNHSIFNLESLKLFFDNWKGRNPMSLQLNQMIDEVELIEKYKAERIIKEYHNSLRNEEFEWN
ncbi:hypothetical protein RhiirA1_537273 [Rhizophagus irregularis]|uniref:F-box domain-containing protein n=1 Tax=Rhizophagus irregularis TaxID=588596 RepID=A0A2N0RLC4_9GLOM|nr:hypothetical protein RhiirA1_537273 [Rhizophagus irregularis]